MLNMVNSEDFVLSEENQTLKAIYYIKHIPEMFRIRKSIDMENK